MSSVLYIASNAPIEERPNPHDKMVSVNEALALGIKDIPDFMLYESFDKNKAGVLLVSDREINFDVDNGLIEDENYDDDFSVLLIEKEQGMRTEKNFCATLECINFTLGRAELLIQYLSEQLQHTTEIELWHIWMDNEPYHKVITREIPIGSLNAKDVVELVGTEVWKEPFTDYCYLIVC